MAPGSSRVEVVPSGCVTWLSNTRNAVINQGMASGRILGKPEVIRFIRRAARWRRFFRCSLAASNFRSRSAESPADAREHVLWRDVADDTVQTHVVVMLYVTLQQTARIFERQGVPRDATRSSSQPRGHTCHFGLVKFVARSWRNRSLRLAETRRSRRRAHHWRHFS